MRLLFIALLVPALAQETNEAEKLYRKMEKQITQSTMLQYAFVITATGDFENAKLKGRLFLAHGNKARLEYEGTYDGKPLTGFAVSDGTTMRVKSGAMDPSDKVTPEKLDEVLKTMISRALLPIDIERADNFEPTSLGVSNFQLKTKEKIGEREAQVITFKVTDSIGKTSAQVTLWLDAKTALPLKRVTNLEGKGMLTEIYTGMMIDQKIDAKLFELPK